MKKTGTIVSIIILLLFLVSLTLFVLKTKDNQKKIVKEGFFFDTFISITVYSGNEEKAVDECINMCERYENLFSRTKEGSDIYRINHAKGEAVEVDKETYYLISKAMEFCEESDGALDITIAPVVDLWGFSDKENTINSVPNDTELKEALSHVNYKNIVLLEDNKVRLSDKDAAIDLGCIAKGYVADKLKEYLISQGVESAVISLGGNVNTIGVKPDKTEFVIGIKDPNPNSENGVKEKLKIKNQSVVTSGTYERYLEINGVKYHHILDVKTGYPVDTKVQSATIISDNSMEGDALSTISLILGEEASKSIIEKHNAKSIFIY